MRKTKIKFAVKLLLLFLILSGSALSEPVLLGDNCDLAVFGADNTQGFIAFDRELRDALSRQDAGVMALLVDYPFRVNDDRGSYYLHDAASLAARFGEIFTPAVRETVLKQRPETVWCNFSGITYGNGVLWIHPKAGSFAIEAINLGVQAPSLKASKGKVEFACNADEHRVIIDVADDGALRYREWARPRPLTAKPDIEISNGNKVVEGTGPCAHPIWRFISGATRYIADSLNACDQEASADGSVGWLQVVSASGAPQDVWECH
jgi:hypothetical protein